MNDKSRPKAAPETPAKKSETTIPQQLRRRRDAAHRSEPLPDGHRDPLDAKASRGRTFKGAWITTEDDRAVFVVKGRGCADVLRRDGLKPMWSVSRRGFVLDLHRLPDAVASLEWAGYVVRVRSDAA